MTQPQDREPSLASRIAALKADCERRKADMVAEDDKQAMFRRIRAGIIAAERGGHTCPTCGELGDVGLEDRGSYYCFEHYPWPSWLNASLFSSGKAGE
jgi:hypothetical protein